MYMEQEITIIRIGLIRLGSLFVYCRIMQGCAQTIIGRMDMRIS